MFCDIKILSMFSDEKSILIIEGSSFSSPLIKNKTGSISKLRQACETRG